MKRLLVIISVITISCQNELPIDYAIVSGKILNSKTKEFTVSNFDRKENLKIIVDSKGNFRDTLKNIKVGIYSFYDGKNYNYFHLGKGDNLKINYDSEDFKNTLTFTGSGSKVNNYLQTKEINKAKIKGDRISFYKLEESAYKKKCQEIKDAELALISSSIGISEEYKIKEKKDINYEYLNNLGRYKNTYSYYAKKPDFKVSDGFLNELDDVDYNNENDYINSFNYKELVASHYRQLAKELVKSDNLDYGIASIKTIGSIPNNLIKNDLLKSESSIKYAEDMKAYYDLFIATSTNEEDKKAITETYNKMKLVSAGQPSPKFVDYENNAGGTTSLDDLKGKYVYIDVWATWCGPCKVEIPFLKKVEQKYHDKNITFLSLSIDRAKDHDKWKKMIKEKELGGLQLFADDAWESKFVQEFQIDGIPHFILLDPDGNIIKYSAPRPSNKKLVELFNELNI